MLIPLDSLVSKYKINFNGVLHVGAHECEELDAYKKYISSDKILWVEALPEKVELCKSLYPGIKIERAVVSDIIESIVFNRSNNGQSSSMLDLGTHKHLYPHIHYTSSFHTQTELLDNILLKYPDDKFNFLNMDIQGAELKALKGLTKNLDKFNYIYTEVNSEPVYKDCCLVTELDDFLSGYGFKRIETQWEVSAKTWGDAFYIKSSRPITNEN